MHIQKVQNAANVEKDRKNKQRSLTACNSLLVFSCLVGLGLSLYAFTVELAIEHDKNYKALCDIGPQMSCTKVFTSSYGKGFGIFKKNSPFHKPNSFFGIVYYSMVATLNLFNSPVAVNGSMLLIILSNFASLFLAYILYFVLNDLCLVCLTTYLINVINLILITKKHSLIRMINELSIENVKSD